MYEGKIRVTHVVKYWIKWSNEKYILELLFVCDVFEIEGWYFFGEGGKQW